MSKSIKTEQNTQKGFLGAVERIGNKLPHPAILFLFMSIIVLFASYIVEKMGTSVTYFDARANKEVTKNAVSLLNADGLRYIFNSATKNFTGFAPLGTVLVAMLGVGVAEWSGLINASLKKLVTSVPARLLTLVIVFAGVMSNVASDAGYVVVIPLGAILFASAGRHPIAGLAAAFSGVSAGFSANLILGTIDPLLAGISNAALNAGGVSYEMQLTGNMYFMQASCILLSLAGAFVTERIIEPRLGEYTGDYRPSSEPLTSTELKGLKLAGLSLVIYFAIMVFLMAPKNAIFRQLDQYGDMSLSYFLSNGLLLAILLAFLIPGTVYGKVTGKVKNSKDIISAMGGAMSGMGGYLVLVFFSAQFVAHFGKSNLGLIISVKGAEVLEAIGFIGLPLVIAFVLISAFLNLFMGSASAKWAIMAPIFIPMLYRLGITPEFTQLAYRIGDSTTNIITPLMSYFAMIVVFMQKYDKKTGLGTLISTMLPYSMVFLVVWILFLIIWSLTGLPIGPGAYMYLAS